jgi:Kef-type K+ transport system membrane component KefB
MLDVLPLIAIALLGTRLAAAAAQRVGMPGTVGELLVGVVLGPIIARSTSFAPTFEVLGTIGVILLLFLAGLGTDFGAVRSVGRSALLIATGGVMLPCAAGCVAALMLDQPLRVALFVGVALSATGAGITVATLRDLRLLHGQAGQTILVTAIASNVLVVVLIALIPDASGRGLGEIVLRLGGFGLMAWILAKGVFRSVMTWLASWLDHNVLAPAVAIALLAAWVATEVGGLTAITGSYMAGVLIANTTPQIGITQEIGTFMSGFFKTMVMVSIGLNLEFGRVPVGMLAGFLALAVVTRFAGCGLIARWTGADSRDAALIGAGMIPRGEVGLVVASLGLQRGVLSGEWYSMLVLVVIGTIVVTPPIFGAVARWEIRLGRQAERAYTVAVEG